MIRDEFEIFLADGPDADEILEWYDRLTALNAQLLAACQDALDHLDRANFDYSNGNKDSTGTIDEGDYYGMRSHLDVTDKLRAAIRAATEVQK